MGEFFVESPNYEVIYGVVNSLDISAIVVPSFLQILLSEFADLCQEPVAGELSALVVST